MKRAQRGIRRSLGLLVLAAVVAPLLGCATKGFVRRETEAVGASATEQIEAVQTQVEENQTALAEHDQQLADLSATARDALDRAVEAGILAEGRFLYERVYNGNQLGFDFDRAELREEGAVWLDEFAGELQERNENVFVEIQGHTDSTGTPDYNLRLGESRAAAVRRYLNAQHRLPLHRMSIISYGETAPITSNDTREQRALNRRVALVVLK